MFVFHVILINCLKSLQKLLERSLKCAMYFSIWPPVEVKLKGDWLIKGVLPFYSLKKTV